MNKNMNLLVAALAITLLSVTGVAAAPVYSNDTQRTEVYFNDTVAAKELMSVGAEGGDVHHFNISVDTQTTVWAGFSGTLTHTLTLSGASNPFYEWTGLAQTGWVLFSTSDAINWGAIGAGNNATREAEDTALGLTGRVDSVNNTFSGSNSAQLDLGGADIIVDSARAVLTQSVDGDAWETVLLVQAANRAYATPINRGNQNYAGVAVDFQTMVPVNNGTGTRTYYLYAAVE